MTGEQYRKARVQAGLTQEALAEELGLKRLTIIRREKGGKEIPAEGRIAIIAILSDSMGSDWSTWDEENSEWTAETFPS